MLISLVPQAKCWLAVRHAIDAGVVAWNSVFCAWLVGRLQQLSHSPFFIHGLASACNAKAAFSCNMLCLIQASKVEESASHPPSAFALKAECHKLLQLNLQNVI